MKKTIYVLAAGLMAAALMTGCGRGAGGYQTAAATAKEKPAEEALAEVNGRSSEVRETENSAGDRVESSEVIVEEAAAEDAVVETQEVELASIVEEDQSAQDNVFSNILDYYYYGIQDKWQHYKEDEEAANGMGYISFMFTSPYTVVRNTNDAGYMLTDIDGDGNEELIVSPMSVASIGLIYDLYTCKNGELYHLAYSGERYAYTLCEGGTITYYGSGGAALSMNTRYSLEGSSLHVVEALNADYMRDEETPWMYGTDKEFSQEILANMASDKMHAISEDEANEIMEGWPQPVTLALQPFSEYVPCSSSPVYSMTKQPETVDLRALTQQELEVIQALADTINDRIENDDLNQQEYNQLNADLYAAWDNELNIIWKRLKEILDKDEMAALTQEERIWIKEKDEKMQEAGAEYEGGSMQPMIISAEGAWHTRERVYELVERYLQ